MIKGDAEKRRGVSKRLAVDSKPVCETKHWKTGNASLEKTREKRLQETRHPSIFTAHFR